MQKLRAMELSIKIWDTPLAKEQVLKLCSWSGTDNPEGTFADQIAHGVNLFTSTIPPKATFDESGEIIKTDYSFALLSQRDIFTRIDLQRFRCFG